MKNGNIIVGTDIGPFVSINGGTSWAALGTGFPTVSIFDMAFTSDGKLLAATHGRGAWLLDLTNVLPSCIPSSGDWNVTVSCTFSSNATAPANVIIQPGVILTIPDGLKLNIDFTHYHLLVKSGGGVLVKAGGEIN